MTMTDSDRDFEEVVRAVYEAARDYQIEHGHPTKSVHIRNTVGEAGQRVGRAFRELEQRGIAERKSRDTDKLLVWWVDPDRYLRERPPDPDHRPGKLVGPEDYLIDTTALPDWVPTNRRQILIADYENNLAQWRRYPCPADDCDDEFEHPESTFHHAVMAHGVHYLELLFGDSYGRVMIELHHLQKRSPARIRDVIPMDERVIRDHLRDRDAFVRHIYLPEGKRPERFGTTDLSVGDWPTGVDGRRLKHNIDVDAAILDD